MRNLIIIALCLFATATGLQAQSITAAKNAAPGAVVTVTGVVTNGSEMGTIRYMQDAQAGIAIYSTSFTALRGDSVSVTGTVSDFGGLIELSPVSNSSIVDHGHTTTPLLITPNQLGVNNDAELVRINNVTFANPGTTIAVNSNYTFTSGGQTGTIYVSTGSALIGQTLPLAPCNLFGLCSTHTPLFQVRPRDINDFQVTANLFFTSNLTQSNTTTTSFDVRWTTNANSNTGVRYGLTTALELGTLTTANSVTAHAYSLTGLQPGTPYYVQGISINGTDTATSNLQTFSTISTSSGTIRLYFNQSVDHSVSTGTNAIYISHIEDTIISYINNAQNTIDVMMYDCNSGPIVIALNSAYTRGVKIRYIADSTTNNSSLGGMNHGIHIDKRNIATGIMHNKIMIIDADDANNAWVYAGSLNFTSTNMTVDRNNILFIQDQALARAYRIEFNEMWGDTGLTPNQATKHFGANKINNTPHDFYIGGKHVELYFSPTDNTTAHIASTIATANHDVRFATLDFTRSDLETAIRNVHTAGATAQGMIQNINDVGSQYLKLIADGIDVQSHQCSNGLLHHKYAIVDASLTSSDPAVSTGSHNWSSAAENTNDENSLVIHDSTIANEYLQEWTETYDAIALPALPPAVHAVHANIPGSLTVVNLLTGATEPNCQVMTITLTGGHTKGTVHDNADGTITYSPNAGATGVDTVYYQVCDQTNLCTNDTAYLTLPLTGINNVNAMVKSIAVYPNPADNLLNIGIYIAKNTAASILVSDLTGKKVMSQNLELLNGANTLSLDISKLSPGLYFLTVQTNGETLTQKFSK